MTIKLMLLKSGEDIISDVSEMSIGDGDDRRVIGYYLNKPCVIKMRKPNILPDENVGREQKAGYEISLFPWMPLSAEETIPIPADWLITMVDPIVKLKQMYVEDVLKNGKNNEDSSTNERLDSDQSD
jgi:hypothetical protein